MLFSSLFFFCNSFSISVCTKYTERSGNVTDKIGESGLKKVVLAWKGISLWWKLACLQAKNCFPGEANGWVTVAAVVSFECSVILRYQYSSGWPFQHNIHSAFHCLMSFFATSRAEMFPEMSIKCLLNINCHQNTILGYFTLWAVSHNVVFT